MQTETVQVGGHEYSIHHTGTLGPLAPFINAVFSAHSTQLAQTPEHLDPLLQLAKLPLYIKTLEDFKQKYPVTYRTQHAINTRLAHAIDRLGLLGDVDLQPSFSVVHSSSNFFQFLGRGTQPHPLSLARYRFLFPSRALQTFTHLHHLNKRFDGFLAKIWRDPDDLAAMKTCTALCAHFLGEYTNVPLTKPQMDCLEKEWQLNPYTIESIDGVHEQMSPYVAQGVKLVGAPGMGKTTLLSDSLLLTARQNIDTTVVTSGVNQFGAVSFEFGSRKATAHSYDDPLFSTNGLAYTNALSAHINQHVPRDKPHVIIIDPLEQSGGSNALFVHFGKMYKQLLVSHPQLLILSAHSTPFLGPQPHQCKGIQSSVVENWAYTHPTYQFIGMELSHASLRILFTKLINHVYPVAHHPAMHANMASYFVFAAHFTVPTVRNYLSFFTATGGQLKKVLDTQFPFRMPGETDENYSRDNYLNPGNFAQLANAGHPDGLAWFFGSSYSSPNTDSFLSSRTVSSFLRKVVKPPYHITRLGQMDEENGFMATAGVRGASWFGPRLHALQKGKPPPPLVAMPITSTVDPTHHFDPGTNYHDKPVNAKTYQNVLKSRAVAAKYWAELAAIGAKSPRGALHRLTPAFPIFDFVFFDLTGQATFLQLKTGSKDDDGVFYDQAAKDYFDGLSSTDFAFGGSAAADHQLVQDAQQQFDTSVKNLQRACAEAMQDTSLRSLELMAARMETRRAEMQELYRTQMEKIHDAPMNTDQDGAAARDVRKEAQVFYTNVAQAAFEDYVNNAQNAHGAFLVSKSPDAYSTALKKAQNAFDAHATVRNYEAVNWYVVTSNQTLAYTNAREKGDNVLARERTILYGVPEDLFHSSHSFVASLKLDMEALGIPDHDSFFPRTTAVADVGTNPKA